MRRVVIILPRAVGSPDGESILAGCTRLQQIAGRAEIVRLSPVPRSPSPEVAFFGLDPRISAVAHGPLIAAGLGLDPPDSSLLFHLALLSTDGERAERPKTDPTEAELAEIFREVPRIATPNLIPARGVGSDHALIWLDGPWELVTQPPEGLRPYSRFLPAGDGDGSLRRFIDDSINLLTPLEFNQRRLDEGLPPLNMLWPWGQGFPAHLPLLALQQGAPTTVISGSLRCAGLARLVGYRHLPLDLVGTGINVRFEAIAERIERESRSLLVLRQPGDFLRSGRIDEARWLMDEFDRRLLGPILDRVDDEGQQITVLAPTFEPDSGWGLALTWTEPGLLPHHLPFDERAGVEPIPIWSPWDPIVRALDPAA